MSQCPHQPNGPSNGKHDIVTARILVSGLISCGVCCIAGIVVCSVFQVGTPAILGHLACMIGGGLTGALTSLFAPRRNGH